MITNTVSSLTTQIRSLIGDRIKTDGRVVETYISDNKFSLNKDFPDSSSIIVLHNNTQIASQDFTYNSDTNQVDITFITSGQSLTEDDTIDIRFDYYEKYSDTEILQYINSALSYFPLFNYKKLFEIDSSNNIVSPNNTNPTDSELHFIALITSILVDPQNIKISIPDLTISAKRDKSDTEQIKDAFNWFTNYVGTIEITEIVRDLDTND